MVEPLPWDSGFFGFGVARLNTDALTPDVAEAAREWCTDHGVACLYVLSDTACADVPDGFLAVDERITYRWQAHSIEGATPAIRPFEPADLDRLVAIARNSHHDSRFYADPQFQRVRCDDLYALWIQRSCEGWADTVLVAGDRGQGVGYVTCTGHNIGLIAVAESARGRGIGRQLVTAAQRHLGATGHVDVVTQGRNRAGRKLYLDSGFQPLNTGYWYHLHV